MTGRTLEYPRGPVRMDSMRCKQADFNSQEMDITYAAATHTLVNLKKGAEVVKLKYDFTETFNGTLKLGNASDAEAYISDANFPKSGAGVVIINALLAADAAIKLAIGGGGTTGAGWVKLLWEV